MTSFGRSDGHTVGVEEEFFLVDPDTRETLQVSDQVVEAAPKERAENVQYEFYQSVVETATDPCGDLDELREEIRDLRHLALDLSAGAGADLAATATHPTALVKESKVTDKPRYRETVELVGWPALWELVCGQHVHVAVPTREDAIFVHNRMRVFMPHLVLLSANSPFWEGEATGFMSSRLPIWDSMPRAGLPRAFDDWEDFQATVDALRQGGVIEDVTRLWWDVRPRPTLGTVEVRVADMPTPVEDSLALAGLTQALVARLCRARRRGEDLPPMPRQEVLDENRLRATRRGAEATLMRATGDGIETLPAAEAVERAVDFLGDVPEELGVRDAVEHARGLAKGNATGAHRQLAVHDRTDSLAAVVDDVVERTHPP